MPDTTALAALDAAWSSWSDGSAPPPAELCALVETLRDAADLAVRAASFGAARARAIAWQIELVVTLASLRDGDQGRARRPRGFASWATLATLARAAVGEARAELVALAVEAGGGAGSLAPACLVALAPLLDPATGRAWVLAALADEALDTDDQGELLGVLPEADVAVLLPPRIEKAVAIEDSAARWSAIVDLVYRVPETWRRRAGEASRARHGAEPLCFPEGESDEAVEQAQSDLERKHWGAPFTGWRLGEEASGLSEGERGPVLDRAIDAFAAIALTPVSPGNDEGPFWAMAWMLDEPQVRRALGVVTRMEAADWKGDLGASLASLLARLALLGHPDEAERMIPRIGTEASLAGHWRARAWGKVIGARLALDPAARFETLLARAADDPDFHDPEWRYRVLEGTAYVFDDRAPPSEVNIEALVALARSLAPEQRQTALDVLIQHVLRGLPVQRWIDEAQAAHEGHARVEVLCRLAEELRDARLDPTPAIPALLAALDEHPCAEPVWTFRDLCGLRAWIAPEDALRHWTDFLRHLGDRGTGIGVSDVKDELPEVLTWLAGPEAVLAVGRALARAQRRRCP